VETIQDKRGTTWAQRGSYPDILKEAKHPANPVPDVF
jgi:hypothetical protein